MLIEPGGAERLLVNEYIHFKKLGHTVNIVAMEINDDALFGVQIPVEDRIELGTNWFIAMIKMAKYIKLNQDANYLCASGHIEMYLVSLFMDYKYSLHIHHPSFMSFNETDKYSIFQKKHFKNMLKSNFGAARFEAINRNMNFLKKLYINLRAILSINAIKKSEYNFVLSKYAQQEKKILFGIDSNVLCGALDESIFEHKILKHFSEYSKYKYKLLTIARLDENKRIDELLKAFKFFLEIEPNAILFIGGKGPELNNLKNLTKKLEIDTHVKFLGFIPDDEIYDWYAMADLFVSIDWADYRITMYEALGMGTKVLLSNETDVDSYLIQSQYLYTTQPDANSCFAVLKKALESSPSISMDELKDYLKSFTWENYSRKIAMILLDKDSQ